MTEEIKDHEHQSQSRIKESKQRIREEIQKDLHKEECRKESPRQLKTLTKGNSKMIAGKKSK